jgi:hypothetical protein
MPEIYWYSKNFDQEDEPMTADCFEENFTYHAPFGDQAKHYAQIRAGARVFAEYIAEIAPESEERTLALRKVQEAVFWAISSIAINEVDLEGS